ncbi:hypothetical protein K458DRAFT_405196 [Lentithecium fluviatile CBS 122367]|uniref:Uncharacterized protein n=1 Tax=Lentithecium fluviatile CBS 122367 TaxID=1168545 RepID=A0A6G1IY60_9PLEO|nr:hypothetical protein K458DRAFT_405196 [Lentithecium fluviatile CBS 122367]
MQQTHGFDMIPPLQPTRTNRTLYKTFINTLLERYESRSSSYSTSTSTQPRSSSHIRTHSRTKSQGIAQLVPAPHGAYILFLISTLPVIPCNASLCHYFVQFSCSVPAPIEPSSSSTPTSTSASTSSSIPASPHETLTRDVYELARSLFGRRVSWWSSTLDGVQSTGFWDQTYVVDMHRCMMKALETGWVDVEGRRKSLHDVDREGEEEERPPPVPPKVMGDGMGVGVGGGDVRGTRVEAGKGRVDSADIFNVENGCVSRAKTRRYGDSIRQRDELRTSDQKTGNGQATCTRTTTSRKLAT